ncbi:hypothetical protein ABG862_26465, partial [Bacteroides xylanisolvens]
MEKPFGFSDAVASGSIKRIGSFFFVYSFSSPQRTRRTRLSLKPWGIALKFLFLHHENILFPN